MPMLPPGFEQPPCALCGSAETRAFPCGSYHLNLLPPLAVARCRRCGLLFLSPRPGPAHRRALREGIVPPDLRAYGGEAADYAAVTATRAATFEARLNRLEQLLDADRRTGPPRLLDIGASSGALALQARQRGWEAEGVEPALSGARSALRQGLLPVRGVAEALPFAGESFDAAHAHHVFEHLADPLRAAREARRVLKPGGLLFVEVPNQFDNIAFRRDMLLRRVARRGRNQRSVHHLWFFSRRTLLMLLRQAGFEEVRVHDCYGRRAEGWRAAFSLLTRLAGRAALGGPFVQAYGIRPRRD